MPFDHIASTYDSLFSRSAIGQFQRKRVWKYIEGMLPELKGFEMLELNCGTGEDSVLFGEGGFNIVATDITEEMLKITEKKAEQYSMQHKISSHFLDLDTFNETLFDKKFDLIFSNFGGINCINPESLKTLMKRLPTILNPGGLCGCDHAKILRMGNDLFPAAISIQKSIQKIQHEGSL